MAKGERPPAGPLLCPSAAAPPLYLPVVSSSKHKRNKNNSSSTSNNNNNSNCNSNVTSHREEEQEQHLFAPNNNSNNNNNNNNSINSNTSPTLVTHLASRTNSFDGSSIYNEGHLRDNEFHVLSNEFDDEYIRDPYQLRELYTALREQFDDIKVARLRAAEIAIAQGRKPPAPSLFQTIESPRREGLNMLFPPSQDTFTLRCRNEVELRRL